MYFLKNIKKKKKHVSSAITSQINSLSYYVKKTKRFYSVMDQQNVHNGNQVNSFTLLTADCRTRRTSGTLLKTCKKLTITQWMHNAPCDEMVFKCSQWKLQHSPSFLKSLSPPFTAVIKDMTRGKTVACSQQWDTPWHRTNLSSNIRGSINCHPVQLLSLLSFSLSIQFVYSAPWFASDWTSLRELFYISSVDPLSAVEKVRHGYEAEKEVMGRQSREQ